MRYMHLFQLLHFFQSVATLTHSGNQNGTFIIIGSCEEFHATECDELMVLLNLTRSVSFWVWQRDDFLDQTSNLLHAEAWRDQEQTSESQSHLLC